MKELLNFFEWVSIGGMAASLAAAFVGWMPRQKAYFWVVIFCILGMIVDGLQGYIGDLVISGLLTLFWIAMWKMSGKEDDDDDDGIPEEEEEVKVQLPPPVIQFETKRQVASCNKYFRFSITE